MAESSSSINEEPLSPLSPKSQLSRPTIVRKQSSRLWDASVEDHFEDNGDSLKSMLSPPRSSMSPLHTDGRVRSEASNQLWGAAASTLSPNQLHRKSVSEIAKVHNIAPKVDDESSDGDSVTSNVSEKMVEAAMDFGANVDNEETPMGTLASSWIRTASQEAPPPLAATTEPLSGGGNGDSLSEKSNHVLNRWRRMVLCMVHLRFADCAGQQEDSFHASELFPMATPLTLTENVASTVISRSKKSRPGDPPTRRATLFGSIMGIYRSAIQEGVVSVFQCIGDDMHQISQSLRVKKSLRMHRVQKSPIFYDHIRKNEPRVRPSVTPAAGFTGLLLKLITTIKNKDKIKRKSSSKVPTAAPGERRESYHHSIKTHHNQSAHDAHLKKMKAEQRALALNERKHRMHDTYEFYLPRPRDIFSILRQQYDPEGLAHPANPFYTPANLLRREALRFDERIQFLLRTIWKATDLDNSGAIDKAEYFDMHGRILCALLGKGAGDVTMRSFLAMEDWETDCQGFKTLNRRRLEDCYFTLADRFTAQIAVADYTNFLNRLLGRMVNVGKDGVVTFKSTEEIFELGEKDPLLDENSVFQFESKEERESQEKQDRRKSIAEVASKLGRGSVATRASGSGTFRRQRSRSMSEVSNKSNDKFQSSTSNTGMFRTTLVKSYHDEEIDFEPQERDIQRWKKLFELAGGEVGGGGVSGPKSRDEAIRVLRSYHNTPVVDIFQDAQEGEEAHAEDLEAFLEAEFELPGHANKRQSLRADEEDDIFAELLTHLPFQAFRDFDEFCKQLQRRRRMVVNSRKMDHRRTTFHGAISSGANKRRSRPGSATGGDQDQWQQKQRRPSAVALEVISSPDATRQRPSSAAAAIGSPPTSGLKKDSPVSTARPNAARKVFTRDSLSINTSKRSSDSDPYQGTSSSPSSSQRGSPLANNDADANQWAPSLSPLPATPLPGDSATIYSSAKSRSKTLDSTGDSVGRNLMSDSFDENFKEDRVLSELRTNSSPMNKTPRNDSAGDEILYSLEMDEDGYKTQHDDVVDGSPNSNPPSLPEKDDEENKQPLAENDVEVDAGKKTPTKSKIPYKNIPTKHLPKYKALYNFVPYEEIHLSIEKGDILYAIPDLDSPELPSEAGWTYVMVEGNIELRGYVPDTFILFLAPNPEELKNKYHIALVQSSSKERVYDVPDTNLFKINTKKAREQQRKQQENDALLAQMNKLDFFNLKDELMKRGLDVKGDRDALSARLREELRDKGFAHGETVDYESVGGTRHRAVIIHSSRSDPSVILRGGDHSDSSKVSTLPSIVVGEEDSLDRESVKGGGSGGGGLAGGSSIVSALLHHSIEEGHEVDDDGENAVFNDDDDGCEPDVEPPPIDQEFDESEKDMASLKDILKSRQRKHRDGSHLRRGNNGRLLYPTGDWNLKFPGYNFDSSILWRQRGVQAQKTPPYFDTKMYGAGVHIGSAYPAAAPLFHNNGARNSDANSLQAASRFPNRVATANTMSGNSSSRPMAVSSDMSQLYGGGAGNLHGRPISAGAGYRATRMELTPSRISIGQPQIHYFHNAPNQYASIPKLPGTTAYGGKYQNSLSKSFPAPAKESDIDLNNMSRVAKKEPRILAGGGGGFYYATPDHTFAQGPDSFDHYNGRLSSPPSFLESFGVGGTENGDPPSHLMPPSFWVYGARMHNFDQDQDRDRVELSEDDWRYAQDSSPEQMHNILSEDNKRVNHPGMVDIPSRVPYAPHSTMSSQPGSLTSPSTGLFDKQSMKSRSGGRNSRYSNHSQHQSSLSRSTPEISFTNATRSSNAFHPSPQKAKSPTNSPLKSWSKKSKDGCLGQSISQQKNSGQKSSQGYGKGGGVNPYLDPRPRPKPDDVSIFPWRQQVWEAHERAQKYEEKKYAAKRALIAATTPSSNPPLLLRVRNKPSIPVRPQSSPASRSRHSDKSTNPSRRRLSAEEIVVGKSSFFDAINDIDIGSPSEYEQENRVVIMPAPNDQQQQEEKGLFGRNKESNYHQPSSQVRKSELVNQALPKVMIGDSKLDFWTPTQARGASAVPHTVEPREAYSASMMRRRPASGGNRLGPFEARLEAKCWNSASAKRAKALSQSLDSNLPKDHQIDSTGLLQGKKPVYAQFGIPRNYRFPQPGEEENCEREGNDELGTIKVGPASGDQPLPRVRSDASDSSKENGRQLGADNESSVFTQQSSHVVEIPSVTSLGISENQERSVSNASSRLRQESNAGILPSSSKKGMGDSVFSHDSNMGEKDQLEVDKWQ